MYVVLLKDMFWDLKFWISEEKRLIEMITAKEDTCFCK